MAFIWRRLLVSIPVLLGVSFLTFLVVRLLPGDPVAFMLQQSSASADVIARLRSDLELDKPLLVQYANFMGRLAHGDLGRSQ